MAFINKVGTMLRHSVSGQSALSGQTSMLNALRCMSTKLYVGGLSYGINDESLKEAFSSFGDVEFARVIVDRESGRSKGFGFVNYHTEECANAALAAMNGLELNGRNIMVSYAQERAPRAGFGGGSGGGYGGGGGGYGGGSSGGYGGGNRGGY